MRFNQSMVVLLAILLSSIAVNSVNIEAKNEFDSGPGIFAGFSGGDGSKSNPYQISSASELQLMGSYTNKNFVLINDIDASSTASWNSGSGFKPVGGTTWQTSFSGTFDGNGYNISGLTIKRSSSNYVGLFAYMNSQTSIKNVNLLNITVSGNSYVGGLVGYGWGKIDNCTVEGEVTGKSEYIGGFIGFNYNDYYLISNCRMQGDVNGKDATGGFVGMNNGHIINCSREGNTSGSWKVGGFVGNNYLNIDSCFSIGYTSGGSNAGGFAGESRGKISNCYSQGTAYGSSSINKKAGGFIGLNRATVTNCYSTCFIKVNGNPNPVNMGFAASGVTSTMTGNFWDNQTSGQATSAGNATGKYTRDMKNVSTFNWAQWDISDLKNMGTKNWYIDENYDYPRLSFEEYIDLRNPVAEAGGDFLININATVAFNGSMSTDNVEVVKYEWDFIDKESVTLLGETPTYRFKNEGIYEVTLTVHDKAGLTDSDIMTVIVRDIENPVADAGPNQTVNMHTLVTFNGSGSTDNVGVESYSWNIHVNEVVTITGIDPSYNFTEAGEFIVELNVSDLVGNWDTDNMTVTILDTEKPVADAGEDIVFPIDSIITFNGSGSTDNVGVVDYQWTFDLDDPIILNGVDPSYRINTSSIVPVTLNVSDAVGNWDVDTLNLIPQDFIDPVAEAGSDRYIDMGDVLRFDGTGSSDNVGLVEYVWTFEDPDMVILHGPDPEYQFNNSGIFLITLKASDFSGNWAVDTLTVNVRDIEAPIPEAGPNQTIDMRDIIFFDGSGSTDNVGIVNFTWTFFDQEEIILYGSSPFFTFNNAGIFNITMTVSDEIDNSAEDNFFVQVNDIEAPVSKPRSDLNFIMEESGEFDGTLSTDNVGVVNYTWIFNNGSEEVVLYGPSPGYTFSIPGLIFVSLKVTDEVGNWDIDMANITVKDPIDPEAESGGDRIIAINNTAYLDGSGSTDNDVISDYIWEFEYNGEQNVLEGENVSFMFGMAGEYNVVLMVKDRFGNEAEDRFTITVVKEGTYFGRVLDSNGNPVAGALIEITTSADEVLTTETDVDGNFSIEIEEGFFSWKISKDGYETASGTSTIRALEEKELPSEETELSEVRGGSFPMVLLIILAVVIILGIAGSLVLIFFRKRKDEVVQEDTKEADEEDGGGNDEEVFSRAEVLRLICQSNGIPVQLYQMSYNMAINMKNNGEGEMARKQMENHNRMLEQMLTSRGIPTEQSEVKK